MEIEETFDVRFSDAEAQSCRTVGDVFSLVLAKSPDMRRNAGCLSRIAFYRLRSSFQPLLNVTRTEFHPRTALRQLVWREDLPSTWARLERSLGFRLPHLTKDACFDRWARRSAVWLVAYILAALIAAAIDERLAVAFALAAGYLLLFCLGCIAAEYALPADELPDGIATVGDLARAIRWHHQDHADARMQSEIEAATSQAWDLLVALFCKHLAVEKDQVTPAADIVRDLGAC